jgi:hypothetical protein
VPDVRELAFCRVSERVADSQPEQHTFDAVECQGVKRWRRNERGDRPRGQAKRPL